MTKLEKAVGPMVWAYKQGFGTTAGDLMEYMESRDWTAFVEGIAELAAQGLGEASGEVKPGESAVRLGTPALFQSGDYTLNSGQKSNFKIDCDALTDEDIASLALMIALRVQPFSDVRGIPRGGLRLAEALKPYRATTPGQALLLVDDVLTTGGSMKRAADAVGPEWQSIIGAVIFARGDWPGWITPLFSMSPVTR